MKLKNYIDEEVLNAGAVHDITNGIVMWLGDLDTSYSYTNVKNAKQIFKNIQKEMKKLGKELNRN
jgi:hypothetical protein